MPTKVGHPTSGPQLIVLLVLLAAASVLVRKGRNNPASKDLAPRQRIRPLALEWLDPLISLAVVGALLWHYCQRDIAHVGMAVVGGVIGLGIGVLRARVMFVRALPASRSVVLARSTAEYLLLGLLIVLKSAENPLSQVQSDPFTLILTALLALAVVESVARSIGITVRYRRSAGALAV